MAKTGSLRGLPPVQVQAIYDLAKVDGAAAAELSPTLNIGAGSHPDCTVMAPHSHTHNEGDMPSQALIRTDFAKNASGGQNVPTKSEYHGQQPTKGKTFYTMLNSLLGT